MVAGRAREDTEAEMTEKTECCPFCATPIPSGASVCRGCGANRGIRGELMGGILLVGALYLFWGPGLGLLGLTHLDGNDPMAIKACLVGGLVTIIGFFPLR